MYIITKDKIPFTEPVTVQECKDQAYLPDNPQENLIQMYIRTARQHIEQYCNVALVPKVIEAIAVGNEPIMLHLPVTTFLEAKTTTNNEDTTVNDTDLFIFQSRPALIKFKNATSYERFYLKYESAVDADVAAYKPYILIIVTHLYENRTLDTGNINKFDFLLNPLRKTTTL